MYMADKQFQGTTNFYKAPPILPCLKCPSMNRWGRQHIAKRMYGFVAECIWLCGGEKGASSRAQQEIIQTWRLKIWKWDNHITNLLG